MKRINPLIAIVFISSVIIHIGFNAHFGWNLFPESPEEAVTDLIFTVGICTGALLIGVKIAMEEFIKVIK